jgi:Integrase core domain/Chromo (CHRromatin Organisation MOdifier) domain
MDQVLTKIFYDIENPAGFASVRKLWEATGKAYTLTKIKNWLAAQNTYTLHKQKRLNFKRSVFFVSNIDDIWQADLNDMRSVKNDNDGFCYLLTVIDTFSKYVWVEPLKRKTGLEVTAAFEKIFRESGRKPLKLNCDQGKEFLNKSFINFLNKHDVEIYTTADYGFKAAIVERLNRTLKTRMAKYLTYRNTKRYIDILPMIVSGYNNSLHSSIKMTPSQVNDRNVLRVWKTMYGSKLFDLNMKSKFKIGERVRVSVQKNDHNFSEEIFTVQKTLHRNPVMYILKDLESENISGAFYEHELTKVILSDGDSLFKIDKIVSKKGHAHSLMYLVRWLGYPKKFDSWVRASDIVQI